MVPSPLRMNRAPEPIPVQMPEIVATSAAAGSAAQSDEAKRPADEELPPIVSAAEMRERPKTTPLQEEAATPSNADLPAPAAAPAAMEPAPAASNEANPTSDERLAAIGRQRDALIAILENEIRQRRAASASDADLPRLEQELRLLYAAGQRPDDAARAVESLSEAERESYKHLMFGLSTWLAEDESRRAPLRNARVLRSLREATSEMSGASKLDLRNLAFCERVESFGRFTEFSRNEFQPNQQVILHVEVENFAAEEKGPRAFETELQGHYQIFDARGNIVAERKLPLADDICRNFRRDFFLAYPIYIPDGLAAGRYRLELTIEDLKAAGSYQGRKFGEGTIEFTIRN
jgi:hypothetical protein